MSDPRYAIYFVPPAAHKLYRFGAAVLGYDCYTGATASYPDFARGDWAANWAALTREPRRYGFHATLKAPFRLKAGISEGGVTAELRRFAAQPRPVPAVALAVKPIGNFVALVPSTPSDALQILAADCVRQFDRFRAPPTPAELQRRRQMALTPRQDDALQCWGYPYVFDDFQFHMTLTGPLAAGRRMELAQILSDGFAQQCGDQSVTIDHLVLARQDSPSGSFRVIAQVEIMSGGHGI